jgi:uncharacterized protein (TIGR04206 family)
MVVGAIEPSHLSTYSQCWPAWRRFAVLVVTYSAPWVVLIAGETVRRLSQDSFVMAQASEARSLWAIAEP